MSYLPSYILLAESIRTHNCRGIVQYKNELQSLSPDVQLDLFTKVLFVANIETTAELALIINTYCPAILYNLLHFSINTRNYLLFSLLYKDYGVMRLY